MKPILTISILCSQKEEQIKRCLDSIQSLINKLNIELILTNVSGSSTVQDLLLQYTDSKLIFPYIWENDFSKARNLGLSHARGEWFMYLDDDEWFEDTREILHFFQTGEYKKYGSAQYIQRNYSTKDGSQFSDMWVGRMIKLDTDTHFEGKIHEYFSPMRGAIKQLPSFVHHYGYIYDSKEAQLAHSNRNLSLLLEMRKEEPNNLRWPLHMLKEYNIKEAWDEMRKLSFKELEKLQTPEHVIGISNDYHLSLMRGVFYTAILMADLGLANYLQEDFKAFITDPSLPPYVLCSLYKNAAIDAMARGDYVETYAFCDQYFENLESFLSDQADEEKVILNNSAIFVRENVEERIFSFMQGLQKLTLEKFEEAEKKKEMENAKKEDAQKTAKELNQLLINIDSLIDTGHIDQALTLLHQLNLLFPDNSQVLDLYQKVENL